MDIGNLTSPYMDIYANAKTQAATKLEGELKSDYSKASDEELMKACKQFEAYFLEQVFKEMQKTVSIGGKSSESSNTMVDYFKDQTIQDIAAQSTETNSLGLAQMLYEQMRRNYGVSPDTITKIEE